MNDGRMRPFKNFQFRWKETLGDPKCPYLYRWVLILFGYSFRLHHWVKSDDNRHLHDHAWNFYTFIIRGHYYDVTESGEEKMEASTITYRNAEHKHYVRVPEGGCWTLLLTGKRVRKWGFWVRGNHWRPLRYFSSFGTHPCE